MFYQGCAHHTPWRGLHICTDILQLLHLKQLPTSFPHVLYRVFLLSDPAASQPERRQQSVMWIQEYMPCETWEKRDRKRNYWQTKHRSNFIFLLTYSQKIAIAPSLFLLFSCFQNIGCQSLAEVLVGLWLHDLELFAIKFHPLLFTSILSYPSHSHDMLILLCIDSATQPCVTSIIFRSLPLLILSLEVKTPNKYRALFFFLAT